MKFKKFLISLLILFLIGVAGCGCEEPPPDSSVKSKIECKDFPEIEGPVQGVITQATQQRKFPVFDPNNPSQFVYLRVDDGHYDLVLSNLRDGTNEVLITDLNVIGPLDWGMNGDLLFINRTYGIESFNVETRVRNVITSDAFHLYPRWISDTSIICHYSKRLARPYYGKKITKEGQILDTIINNSFFLGHVSQDDDLAYLEYKSDPNIMVHFNNSEKMKLSDFQFDGSNTIECIHWIPNSNSILFSTYKTGIWRVDVDSKEFTQLVEGCDTRSFRTLSISSDGSTILAELVNAYDFDTIHGNWIEESTIVKMDISGCNETKVF